MAQELFTPIDKWNPPEVLDFARDFPPPRVFAHRGSFVWWWWMFFYKEGGVRKQAIAFWTTKTYGKLKVSGQDWNEPMGLEGDEKCYSLNTMSTFWIWDGKQFKEAKPVTSRLVTDTTKGVSIVSDHVAMHTEGKDFKMEFKEREGIGLKIDSILPTPPPVKYKRTMVTKKMGFDTLKIYHAGWRGRVLVDGKENEVDGSLYMQNICLNTPAFPWLWGVFHKDDGSYFTYFTTFIGPYMFRKKPTCAPRWDNRFKPMNKNLNYTPAGQETKRFKHVRYKVVREGKGLPGFELSGELGDERLRIKVQTLGKNTYDFDRKRLFRNRFFYNEYPSKVVSFEHTDADGKVHKDDPELWTGNCEHSWGLLINKN